MLRRLKIILLINLCGLLLFIGADRIFPLPLGFEQDTSTTITAEDGRPLRVFADSRGVWQFKTQVSDVAPLYLQALVNYEDRYFYYHLGINPVSVLRAVVQNIEAGRIVSGASTLTMQVARLIDPHGRSIAGKLKQVFRALQLEWHLSKDEILSLYLELAPFGGNLQGVEAASRAYFDKSAIELSHAEAALLAVLPQAPSRFRPDRFPKRAAKARNKVVKRLVDKGLWKQEISQEVNMEVVFANSPAAPVIAPLLARRLLNNNSQSSIINTSIDYGLQLAMQTRLKDYVAFLPQGTTAAAVIVENKPWLVKAYVGSALFADIKTQGYVDMVTATRSPGSTLKPFIYGLALDESLIHSKSLLVDAPRWQSDYQPENFSSQFHGAVSATAALQKSLNIPAVQLLEKLTPEYFKSRLQNVSIYPSLPAGQANLSMALGGLGLSMEDLLNLYGAIGRAGQVAKLRFSPTEPLQQRPLLSAQSAWIIYQMLASQKRADRPFDSAQTGWKNTLAFKTGTSYGYRDAWAFGVTGKYTLGVWVGRPDGTPSPGQYGAITALPLLFQLSDWLDDSSPPEKPIRVSEAKICWPSGLIASEVSIENCHVIKKALGIDGQFPVTLPAAAKDLWRGAELTLQLAEDTGLRVEPACGVNSIEKKLALWPVATEPWLKSAWQRKHLIPLSDLRCRQQLRELNNEFAILSIKNAAHIRNLQPDKKFQLPLTALGSVGRVHWYLDGNKLNLIQSSDAALIWLKSGKHELLAIDDSGAIDKIRFIVEQW